MRNQRLFRLLAPIQAAIARQLAHPHGWFGRVVMTRILNRGNRQLIVATLDGLAVGPGDRLLDVGFGGGLLLELARRRGVTRLAGADPSDAVVRGLRDRPPRWLAGAELRVQQGRADSLPFADEEFDALASTNTVYFWPDPAAAFREIGRVLRPGGRLALGFSGAAKLRQFDGITSHGFHLHENDDLLAAAGRAGLTGARLVELHGGNTEGDFLLLASRSPAAA
jgi:SAM-dependent methyltransferase